MVEVSGLVRVLQSSSRETYEKHRAVVSSRGLQRLEANKELCSVAPWKRLVTFELGVLSGNLGTDFCSQLDVAKQFSGKTLLARVVLGCAHYL